MASLAFLLLFPGKGPAQEPPAGEVRNFQVSLFPVVGSDGTETVRHTYRLSMNLFAGITGGIDGIEGGGFLNLTHGQVRGVQLAGFGNLVRGPVHGLQGAGFINVAGGDASGFRAAGFINTSGGSSEGFQGAGFANISGGHGEGFFGAGFANIYGGRFQGFSGAGFANITGGNADAFMGAGFANITGGDYNGFQAAGFGNFTGGEVNGPQLAGFMNLSGDLKGIQAAGFMNIAREVQGIQLGFINIADTISGVPVGFLSVVRRGGLRQLEIAASDALHLNASFRLGVPAFYNIFSAGTRLSSGEPAGGFGYGLGGSLAFGRHAGLNLEAHSTRLLRNWEWGAGSSAYLNEARLLLRIRGAGPIEAFAGVVLYNHLFETDEWTDNGHGFAPSRVFAERPWREFTSLWWLGARGGLRVNL